MLCCGKKVKKKKVKESSVVSHDNNAFVENETIKGDKGDELAKEDLAKGADGDKVEVSSVVKELVMGDGGTGKDCVPYSNGASEEGKTDGPKSILQKNCEVYGRSRKESLGGRRRSVSFHLPGEEVPLFTNEQLEVMFKKADGEVADDGADKQVNLEGVESKEKNSFELKLLAKSLNAILDDKEQSESDDDTPTENLSSIMSNQVPALTKPAPVFKGTAVVDGQFKEISLEDYKGQYVVFFFYPLDFTFVCPTEIIAFSERAQEFRNIGCEVIACSTDSHFSHLAWVNTPRKDGGLGEMKIPLLADKSMKIAKDYGVLKEDEGIAFRGLFIIDKNGNLRQATINDLPVGRDVDETLRLVQAFQFTDEHGEVCPAGWKPGAKTMKADPVGSKEYFQTEN